MRKLTPKTRSGLRSSANECDFREIRFYKTFLKADDDLRQRVIGRKPCLRRERQFGTRKRSRQCGVGIPCPSKMGGDQKWGGGGGW